MKDRKEKRKRREREKSLAVDGRGEFNPGPLDPKSDVLPIRQPPRPNTSKRCSAVSTNVTTPG